MNRFLWISAISISLFSTVGCNAPQTSQEGAVLNSEVAVNPSPSPQVAPKKDESNTLAQIPQLTPSTSAEERLAQLKEGQRDPFSPLETHAIVTPGEIKVTKTPPSTPPPEVTVKPNPVPSVQPLPVTPPPPPVPAPIPQLPTLQPTPVQELPQTIEVAQVQPIPAPSPVKPSGAEAVKVTGVAELPDGMRAILKAPDEPTSRYVVAGESLSNGRIRVKRIEIASSGNPIVVLEENGKEFIKTVSDRP
ncbi:hypothetical protein PMG71_15040 [Roseofilum sp. BLCC_M154]|uniref:Type II secretion system protein GspC N-terminal domain-containing protein n=1 Tax=Roseofilum acuticapitatum BLCC-M154 TaxID=3022444 RepID=A0ABT7AV10_9CYAN|nr:hypothetical protein [Roseofilum acuticapitatum]MDJ1170746.1 hypothetical protein [Roseofilum acuticapitatum BLCC-M154]